ncbi:MAG: FecR family protein, partial [Bacteroidales bacterium]|nr:FecR family protein [Bacteroidales bacterium]
EMSLIDMNKAKKEIKSRIPEFNQKTSFWSFWQKAAAILLLPVILISGYFFLRQNKPVTDKLIYKETTAAYGFRSKLNLPDGTVVWLNSGSKLKYPESFYGGKREVFLTGEAFFEVEHNPNQPFYVNLGELSVKATGTSFNISAYGTEKTYETTLITGNVQLVKQGNNNNDIVLHNMKPNEHAVYNKEVKNITFYENILDENNASPSLRDGPIQSINRKTAGLDVTDLKENKYTSWIDGKLVFRNDDMEYVSKKLGRWYNVDIQLDDTVLYDFQYTATFVDETIEQVLELLALSAPIEYNIVDRKINNDQTFTKKHITLKLKNLKN